MITVYSKPACQQCTATKRYLDERGIEYIAKDVTQDESAFEEVRSLGYQQLPVVSVGDRNWSGFNPFELASL